MGFAVSIIISNLALRVKVYGMRISDDCFLEDKTPELIEQANKLTEFFPLPSKSVLIAFRLHTSL